MIAFALALLTALAVAALTVPLLMRRGAGPGRREYNLAVYRDQLAEIDRDRERGVLNEPQAQAARTEIERRMLATAAIDGQPGDISGATPSAGSARTLRHAIFALGIVLPLAALGWYFATGQPELPARPFAERNGADETTRNAGRLLDELQQRLQAKPDDLQGWLLLGRTALRVGRYDQATMALSRAVTLAPERADLLANYAEAMILRDNGKVGPLALQALDSALARDGAEPSANYYRGLADLEAGNPRATLQRWLTLEAGAPADAPWLTALRDEIARVSQQSGIDPQSIRPDRKPPAPPSAPSVAPRPSAQDVERMAQLSPAEREKAIRSMVDGLEARLTETPDDVAGWQRLGKARLVLGDADKAVAAFAEASTRRPDDVQLLGDLAEAQLRAGGADAPPSAGATATLRRMLVLQPGNPLALFYLARVDAEAGDTKAARDKLSRLLAQIPPGEPQRAAIEQLMQSLPAE